MLALGVVELVIAQPSVLTPVLDLVGPDVQFVPELVGLLEFVGLVPNFEGLNVLEPIVSVHQVG